MTIERRPFTVGSVEMRALHGAGALTMALYFLLKTHAEADGQVVGVTSKSLAADLTASRNHRGGPQPAQVTAAQVRGSLEALDERHLIVRDLQGARASQELRISLTAPR